MGKQPFIENNNAFLCLDWYSSYTRPTGLFVTAWNSKGPDDCGVSLGNTLYTYLCPIQYGFVLAATSAKHVSDIEPCNAWHLELQVVYHAQLTGNNPRPQDFAAFSGYWFLMIMSSIADETNRSKGCNYYYWYAEQWKEDKSNVIDRR